MTYNSVMFVQELGWTLFTLVIMLAISYIVVKIEDAIKKFKERKWRK